MNTYGYYPNSSSTMMPSGQFYMFLGGPAASNSPFPSNFGFAEHASSRRPTCPGSRAQAA